MGCARVMRGIDSIANATTPCVRSRSMPSASVSGWRNAMRTSPLLSFPTCSADGFCTMTIASAWPRTASTTDAPAASYSPSSKPAGVPAPRSTATGEAGAHEARGDVRHEGHTALARRRLFRDPHQHAAQLYAERLRPFVGREPAGAAWNHRAMALMDLARAIESRDPYSSGHAARVTAIAEVVAAGSAGTRIRSTSCASALRYTTSASSPFPTPCCGSLGR